MKNRIVWATSLIGMILPLLSFDMAPHPEPIDESYVGSLHQAPSTAQTAASGILASIFEYFYGVIWGLNDYLTEMLRCLKFLILHPIASLHEFLKAAYRYDETYLAVKRAITRVLGEYHSYSIAQKARLHAMVFSEITLMLVPTSLPFATKLHQSSVSIWAQNAVSRVKPMAQMVLDRVKSASPLGVPLFARRWVNQFDPVVAAEWFASEGQPSNR